MALFWYTCKLFSCLIIHTNLGSTINSTDEAMAHVHALFPSHKFADEMPAIIWKHQLYPLVANRTDVDRNLVTNLVDYSVC